MTNGGMTTVPNCSSGPVSIMYDHCLDNGSPALVGFIAGDIKVEWVHHSVSAFDACLFALCSKHFCVVV